MIPTSTVASKHGAQVAKQIVFVNLYPLAPRDERMTCHKATSSIRMCMLDLGSDIRQIPPVKDPSILAQPREKLWPLKQSMQ